MHLSTPSTSPKRKERQAGFPLHWAAQSDAVAVFVRRCRDMLERGGLTDSGRLRERSLRSCSRRSSTADLSSGDWSGRGHGKHNESSKNGGDR